MILEIKTILSLFHTYYSCWLAKTHGVHAIALNTNIILIYHSPLPNLIITNICLFTSMFSCLSNVVRFE